MVSALTASQRQALSGLLDVNSGLNSVNGRIQTGKSISSILDGPAAFLQSERLNTRANNLLEVNKSLDLTLSAVSAAQTGIDKIKKDLSNSLTELKTLQGTKQQAAATTGAAQNETIRGITRTVTTETGTVTGTAPNPGRQAVSANRRIFGTTASPSAAADGNFGLNQTNGLKLEVFTAGAAGVNVPVGSAISFTSNDTTTGNLQDLTIGDVVRKINRQNLSITVGAVTEQVTASIDNSGSVAIRTQTAGGAPGTFNFKMRFSPANTNNDLNNSLGFGPMQPGQAQTNSFATTSLPPSADTFTPPGLTGALAQAMATRSVFDDDAVTTNNGISWDTNNSRLNGGSIGVATGGTLAVKIAGPGLNATPTYLTVIQTDIAANNTLTGLANQLNTLVRAQNLQGLSFSVDQQTGNLTVRSSLGSTVSFGSGADIPAARASADTRALNSNFGFNQNFTTVGTRTPALTDFVADASAVSLVATTDVERRDPTLFQAGDVFSMRVVDTTNGQAKTAYFKAVDTTNNQNIGNDGLTADNPQTFQNMKELQDAINKVFNTGQVQARTVLSGGTGSTASSFQFQLQLDADQALEIEQIANGGDGTLAGTRDGLPLIKNSANALDVIFGSSTGTNPGQLASTMSAEKLLTSGDIRDPATMQATSRKDDYGKKITYLRNAGVAGVDADPRRRASADSLAKILDTVQSSVDTASVAGQPNLLLGAPLDAVIDDKGRSVRISLGESVSTPTLGFQLNAGTTTYTLLAGGLGTDADLTNAMNAVQQAIDKLDGMRSSLGGQSGLLVNSKDYNADISKTLGDAAAKLTASDTTADASEMKALDMRYTLSMSAMGILNNSIMSAAQMLR
jgi:flagellin-like hook-associated protein FlgL